MKKIKSDSDVSKICNFLKLNFNTNILNVTPLKGGEQSKAYAFSCNNEEFVIRVSRRKIGFEKDKYAALNFSQNTPIPEIVQIGQYQERYYAISKKIQGKPLRKDSDIDSPELLKDIVVSLMNIHKIKIPKESKFGVLDIYGKSNFKTWKDWIFKNYILVLNDDESYVTWEQIYKVKFVDKKVLDKLFEELKKFVKFVPNEKYLIHGDFATGNIIIDGKHVTGIIDWSESTYGDFLYDVAWFDFWISKINFATEFRNYYKEKNIEISDYQERIYCHKLFIGLHTLGIYAAIDYEDGYTYTLNKVKQLLKNIDQNK